MKKLLSIIIVLCLANTTLLSSCSPSDNTTVSESTVSTTGAQETEIETAAPLTDELPERDFDGAVYTILMRTSDNEKMKYTVEEMIGDSVNDIAYKRQRDTEERFNIKIAVTPGIEWKQEFSTLQMYLNAGETFVDLIQPGGNGYGIAGSIIAQGLLMDFGELEYIDFSKPWWNENAILNTASSEGIYAAYGTLTILRSDIYALMFNKPMMENYQIELPYDLTEGGGWTADEFLTMVQKVSLDVNGDSVMDESDQYGLAANETSVGYFQFAFDNTIAGFNDYGEIELVYSAERLQSSAEKVLAIASKAHTYLYPSSENDAPRTMFANGQALFYFAPFGMYYTDYRDIEFDYGVLPLPKYDEAQENYITGKANSIYISASTADPERTGIITEALTAYSYLQVKDVFIHDMMEGKLARDERSVEMLDIILNSTGIEVMDVILPENTLLGTVRDSAVSGTLKVQSFIAANLEKTQVAIDNLNAVLNGN